MNISPLQNAAMTQATAGATGTNELGKDAFLKLLIAQLQHQDPLNPADSTEFTAQLAQFSSLETLSSINTNIEDLQAYQSAISNSQAVSYIGKEVLANGDSVRIQGGIAEDMRFVLGGDAASVFLNVYDASGQYIDTIEAGAFNAGQNTFNWDGTDAQGNPLPDGAYRYSIQATDQDKNTISVQTLVQQTVDSVIFENGKAYLRAGANAIAVEDVIEITGG
jgi:flagellar basal-body rod modification protein FlgD